MRYSSPSSCSSSDEEELSENEVDYVKRIPRVRLSTTEYAQPESSVAEEETGQAVFHMSSSVRKISEREAFRSFPRDDRNLAVPTMSLHHIRDYILELHRLVQCYSHQTTRNSTAVKLDITGLSDVRVSTSTNPLGRTDHNEAPFIDAAALNTVERLVKALMSHTLSYCSTDAFYDDDDGDSFVVFERDNEDIDQDSQRADTSVLNNRAADCGNRDLSSPSVPSLPDAPVIQIPSRFLLIFTKGNCRNRAIIVLTVSVEFTDVSLYPRQPPLFRVSSVKRISRTRKTNIVSALDSIAYSWKTGRMLDCSIEVVVAKLLTLMNSLQPPGAKAGSTGFPVTSGVAASHQSPIFQPSSESQRRTRVVSRRIHRRRANSVTASDVSDLAQYPHNIKQSRRVTQDCRRHSLQTDIINLSAVHRRGCSARSSSAFLNDQERSAGYLRRRHSVVTDSAECSLRITSNVPNEMFARSSSDLSYQSTSMATSRHPLRGCAAPLDEADFFGTLQHGQQKPGTPTVDASGALAGLSGVPVGLLSIESSEQWTLPNDIKKGDNRRAYETSRYHRNYEELELLGVGGFGSVTRCRLRVSGRGQDNEDAVEFAIKQIPLSPYSDKQNMALQREAANLAALRHPHIVRYHCAWIEVLTPCTNATHPTGSLVKAGVSAHFSKRKKNRRRHRGAADHSCHQPSLEVFTETTPSSPRRHVPDFLSSSIISPEQESTIPSPVASRCLYIQMEYCSGQSLRKAIDSGVFHNRPALIWTLFHQILDGLACMHANGLIHRDLKPCNIFLQKGMGGGPLDIKSANSSDVHIKIGDFGLTTSINKPLLQQRSFAEIPTTFSVNLSGGVGTKFYMAPEQEKGGAYDHKADMFSLGVVFFELWHSPFKTSMERAVVLSKLLSPERVLSPEFVQSVPAVVPVVLLMLLSPSPDDRPSAQSLLQSMLVPPIPPKGEFRAIYASLARSPFSVETVHLTAALFHAQLHRQIQSYLSQDTNLVEEHFLPSPERVSWKRNQLLTEISVQLSRIFTLRRALRFECPVLLPRIKRTPYEFPGLNHGNTIENIASDEGNHHSNSLPRAAPISLPMDFHRQTVFLDRHGTPVYIPSRLISGFAATATTFLASAPSIARRFAIQNVHCGPSAVALEHTPSEVNFSEHPHAIYDIGVRLTSVLEPDVLSSFTVSTVTAVRNLADPRGTAMLLGYLFRDRMSTSRRCLSRVLYSSLRHLLTFPVLALFELETFSVAHQALNAVINVVRRDANLHYTFYWTHGLLLTAILWDVGRVPMSVLPTLERKLRWKDQPWSKSFLIEELTASFLTAGSGDLVFRNGAGNPVLLTSHKDPKHTFIETAASFLHSIFSFVGTIQGWVANVRSVLQRAYGQGRVTTTEVLLQHLLYLDELIVACIPEPTAFMLALPFDTSVYGKGLVFVASAEQCSGPTRSRPPCSTSQKEEDIFAATGQTAPMAFDSTVTSTVIDNGKSQVCSVEQLNSISLVASQPSANPSSSLVTIGCDKQTLFRNRVVIGGRYDYLISGLSGANPGRRSSGFFAVEVSVGLLTDAAVPKSLGISAPSLGIATQQHGNTNKLHPSCNEAERKMDPLTPRVLVVVLRTEHHIYAVSLRRQLIYQGISCQRRLDRVGDTFQLRRCTRHPCTWGWIVQIRGHSPTGVLYRLQYLGITDHKTPLHETTVVLDTEEKVVEYLADFFSHTNSHTSQKSKDASTQHDWLHV